MSQVVGNGTLLVGQFLDDEFEHVEHTLDHLNLVDVLVPYNVSHEVENICDAFHLFR